MDLGLAQILGHRRDAKLLVSQQANLAREEDLEWRAEALNDVPCHRDPTTGTDYAGDGSGAGGTARGSIGIGSPGSVGGLGTGGGSTGGKGSGGKSLMALGPSWVAPRPSPSPAEGGPVGASEGRLKVT